jgi:flavin reductase (DIM6/NTAB) family NADH-FMN oxidoreductase RutF
MSLTDDFKNALASWASGISVVTTNHEGLLYGLTVSSFSSLSLEPPLVLVCLNNSNRLPEMIEASGRFAVSILRQGQEDASNYFARPDREPTHGFTEIEGEWTSNGVPLVKGCLASIVCTHRNSIEEGTHTIVVGEVVEARSDREGQPLLYWRRGYHRVG